MPYGDAQNFVGYGDFGGGLGWYAFVNGTPHGPYGGQSQAEQAYNAAGGVPPAAATSSTSYSGGTSAAPYGKSSSQLLADAMASSNREEFEEKIRQFNETLAWEQQQYQGNMAMQMLSTAAGLHGQPKDWLKYAQYTQGGQDIFNRIWGSTPAAAFGAPTGTSQPITLADILAGLSGGTMGTGTTGSATTDQALDAIWAHRPDLKSFYEGNGWKTGSVEEQRACVRNWLGMTDDAAVTGVARDALRYAQAQGWLTAATPTASTVATAPTAIPAAATPTAVSQAAAQQATTAPTGGTTMGLYAGEQQFNAPMLNALGLIASYGPGGEWPPTPTPVQTLGPTTSPVPLASGAFVWSLPPEPKPAVPPVDPNATPKSEYLAPLPFQMNPMVWDSLSDTAKQMILGAVEAGRTPSGVWTSTDWLNEFNASRPKGTAPRQVYNQYAAPRSYF